VLNTIPFSSAIKNIAQNAGFELCGVAPASDFPELQKVSEWIENGHAGEMKYMEARDEAGNLKRSSLSTTFPWARSVVVCAINYNTENPRSIEAHEPGRGWISRYAWGQEDYHSIVLPKLRAVEAEIVNLAGKPGDEKANSPNSGNPEHNIPLQTRCYVDTGPISERVLAKYSGIGWIGRNTCLIHPKVGSWIFLGMILTSLDLDPGTPLPDRCGSCTRCIDACPTDALLAPYQLDANRCISYLTIEKRGEIPEPLREGMGRHIFGCDICQDVCPWNRKAPVSAAQEFQPREGLVNPDLKSLVELSEDGFREKFRSSPLKRAKWNGIRRNALVAIGNSGDPGFLSVIEEFCEDEDITIAGHARWARQKILRAQSTPDRNASSNRSDS